VRPGGIAIVGIGGLGAPAAAALASAGAGPLLLIDPDAVELSNLPRQPLYGVDDVGRPKAEVAAARLRAAGARAEARCERIDEANAERLLAGRDVVIDGTDGIAAKDLLNRAALALGAPLVHAGALGLEGQIMSILPGRTACLRCLFLSLPAEEDLASCQQAGVLGPVVGALGLAAAREALAIAAGGEPPLAGRLALLDGARLRWRAIEVRRNPRCPACGPRRG